MGTSIDFDVGNQAVTSTLGFLGVRQTITIPANTTYKVIVIASRTFIPPNNLNVPLNIDVGYHPGANASWSGAGLRAVNSANAPSTGLQGIKIVGLTTSFTIPATVASTLTIANPTGAPVDYTVGMIGTGNGWLTSSGTVTIIIGQ